MEAMQQETRVNIYGDSIMRGTVIDEAMRYHATVAGYLHDLTEKFGLLFKSRAYFGVTIQRGRQLLQKDLLKGLDCNYAVVEYGGNDCSFDWDAVAKDPEADHQPFTSLEDYKTHCTGMTQQLKDAGVTPVLMTLPPLDAERHLHFIGKNEQGRRNILQWLGDAHMIYRFHEKYSKAIEKIALSTQTLLVDVRNRFLDRHDLGELLGQDGIHLSRKGYALVADTFADFVDGHRGDPGRLVFE